MRTSFIRETLIKMLAGMLLLVLPFSLEAQKKDGGIEGTIEDSTGNPLPYVNIRIPSLNQGSSSDENGAFEIRSIPPGTYRILFSELGYEEVERKVKVPEGDVIEMKVRMEEGGIRFETVSITGSSQDRDSHRDPDQLEGIEGREKTERSSASLGETVEDAPGVDHIATGSPFGKPVIRGMSGNRIRLLHDGTPLEYQQYGVRHMPTVDPFLSERIEVLQGPSAVLYGSDALGGVVNNIPHSIPDTRDTSFQFGGKIMGTYHSNDRQWGSGIRLNGGSRGFSTDLSFVRRSGGNIRTPSVPTYSETGDQGNPKFSGELDHTDFDQYNGSAAMGYKGQGWKILGRFTNWTNEHNFLLPNGEGLGQAVRNRTYELRGNVDISRKWRLEASAVHMSNRRRSNAKGRTRELIEEGSPSNIDIGLQNHVDRLTLSHDAIKGFRGKAGVEHMWTEQRTQLDGAPEPLVPSARTRNYGAFLYETYEHEGWTFEGGLRYDHRRQRAEPNEELLLPNEQAGEGKEVLEQSYDALSAGLGINYAINDRFAIASTVGRGFRAPSMFDLHASGVHGGIAAFQRGTPYLSPEYSLNTDLTLKYRSNRLKARVTGYRNRIRDYIFMRNIGKPEGWSGPPVMEADQGNAVLLGGHAFVDLKIMEGFHIEASYQTVRGRNRSSGEELPLMPPSRVKGELRYELGGSGKFERIYIQGGAQHAFAKEAAGRYEPFWQFENLPRFGFGVASTDAYTLFHFGAGADLKLWDEPITLDIKMRNLADEAYRDFLDTYKGYALGKGRDIRIKVTVPF